MAYLIRDARSRSPYWYGVYLVVSPDGQRRWVRKSTKKRKRSEAKEILDAWQNTADRAAAGNLDQARIREIVLETVERRLAIAPCIVFYGFGLFTGKNAF